MSNENAIPNPTDSAEAAAAGVPEGPVGGYELVEAREDAILLAAYLAHKVVAALNLAHNEFTVPWADSRDSTVEGVRRILANPNQTPEQSHISWMEYRKAEGWVYGISKDLAKKTHPCMVPYGSLPSIQQAKDMIFVAIVKAFFGL